MDECRSSGRRRRLRRKKGRHHARVSAPSLVLVKLFSLGACILGHGIALTLVASIMQCAPAMHLC